MPRDATTFLNWATYSTTLVNSANNYKLPYIDMPKQILFKEEEHEELQISKREMLVPKIRFNDKEICKYTPIRLRDMKVNVRYARSDLFQILDLSKHRITSYAQNVYLKDCKFLLSNNGNMVIEGTIISPEKFPQNISSIYIKFSKTANPGKNYKLNVSHVCSSCKENKLYPKKASFVHLSYYHGILAIV